MRQQGARQPLSPLQSPRPHGFRKGGGSRNDPEERAVPVPHDIAAETELWDTFAESAFEPDAAPVFCWTQYARHGPGPELLGSPARVLEIG